MRKSIIVAFDEAGLIGADGKMPWHLPEDLKLFRQLTMGKPVIMGRRTYESLGRPLAGRTNIVLSKRQDLVLPGCVVAHTLDEAFDEAERTGASECMVIGGGTVYEQAILKVDRMYVTLIHEKFGAKAQRDRVYFPGNDWHRKRSARPTQPPVEHPKGADNPYRWTAYVFDLGPVHDGVIAVPTPRRVTTIPAPLPKHVLVHV